MRRFLFFLLFIPLFLFAVRFFLDNTHTVVKVAGISDTKKIISPLSSITPANDSHLGEVVEAELAGTKGTYGIAVINLGTDESFTHNEHTTFTTASLYKLWVMATAYKQIQEGKLKESDMLSQNLDVLYNRFGLASPSALIKSSATEEISDSPEDAADPVIISLSVADALEKMITISDNNAALLLTQRVGLTNIAAFLDKNGFVESMVGMKGGNPISTARDISSFLKKLYDGKLANREYTEKMLDLLKRQRLNGKLPKYLPEQTVIAHKTGELDEYSHDAGIIYMSSGDYIIVVLTETTSREQADERIATLSKAVYTYFANEN